MNSVQVRASPWREPFPPTCEPTLRSILGLRSLLCRPRCSLAGRARMRPIALAPPARTRLNISLPPSLLFDRVERTLWHIRPLMTRHYNYSLSRGVCIDLMAPVLAVKSPAFSSQALDHLTVGHGADYEPPRTGVFCLDRPCRLFCVAEVLVADGVESSRMGEPDGLVRVVRKFRSFEEAERANDEFYRSLTKQQCLDILVELVGREQNAAGGRLERVCRVTSLERG